ncbi:MAG: GGDEF domain-containing protein [Lachnospiraceae bacterium]|nr:GGDEF domain-containing protein [Lachnospiraceae bacterium]
MKKRLNIGFLIDDLDNNFSREACIGAALGAKYKDANLFIFPMKYLETFNATTENDFNYQYNTIYKFISSKNIDILYVMLGTIGTRVKTQEQLNFLDNLPDIPKIMLFTEVPGYPCVVFNNYSGLKDSIEHMIQKHHATRIGFVSGPLTNMDAKERLAIYKSILLENNIEYIENRVVYGTFESDCDSCVEELLDRNPDLEAVIFANDLMAVSGYRVFEKRGLSVGDDILVSGFDNSPAAFSLLPPLTTVESSPNMLAYKSIMEVDKFLNGEVSRKDINTFFIQRNSCGCDEFEFISLYERMGIHDFSNFTIDIDKIFEIIFEEYVNDESLNLIKERFSTLFNLIEECIESKDFGSNKKIIHHTLSTIVVMDEFKYTSMDNVINVMTAMEYLYFQRLSDPFDRFRFSELYSSLYRFMIRLVDKLFQAKRQNATSISEISNFLSDYMLNFKEDSADSYNVIFKKLKRIGFKKMYIYTFENTLKYRSKLKWIQNENIELIAYCDNDEGVVKLPENGKAKHLEYYEVINNEYLPDERVTMTLMPMFLGKELYGLSLSETDVDTIDCISPINVHLSMALKIFKLFKKQKLANEELKKDLELVKRNNEELSEISYYDALTKIYNRRGYLKESAALIRNPANFGRLGFIVSIDLDNLKFINDTFGHDDGDIAITCIADILTKITDVNSIVARIGGDEFVVCGLFDETDLKLAEKKVFEYGKHFHSFISECNRTSGKEYIIDASIGFRIFICDESTDLDKEYDEADKLMYAEKNRKKRLYGAYR